MKCLVTGGLGYIGSHVCIDLLKNGHDVVIIDNMINSSLTVFDKLQQIMIEESITSVVSLYNLDILDLNELESVFEVNLFDCVYHFAALKSIPESFINPDGYYNVNVNGTVNIIKMMKKYEIYNFIFSSSASVYGENNYPVSESDPIGNGLTNAYSNTKYVVEKQIEEYTQDPEYEKFSFMVLRYFNPIGSHHSGLLGDRISGTPTNILPILGKVAFDLLDNIEIYGNDYDTHDGTCVRDYIHINDLSNGHIKVLKFINVPGIHIYNLGTGNGTSVLDLINIYNTAIFKFNINNGCELKKIKYSISERRDGDLPVVYTHTNKASNELDWGCNCSLYDMCYSSLNFIYNNI